MEEDDPEPIASRHDKLFGTTFSVPANAAAFLRAQLPAEVSTAIDWARLKMLPGTFVDSQFRRSQTDLLFSAPVCGKEGLIYLLFEHQSTPDAMLPLRLLRYITRIWERAAKERPAGAPLPVVLPVVLSQNAEIWAVPPRLSTLLDVPPPLAAALSPYVPDFEYLHLQLASMPFDAISGTPSGVVVLRVMKAERLRDLLGDAVWDERMLDQISPELWQMVLRYMLAADIDRAAFQKRIAVLLNAETRNAAMTLAQQYQKEGHEKGLHTGLQKGRQEYILETLRIRFDAVPDGLEEAVRAVTDDARLGSLLRAAIRCGSVEEFSRSL